MRLFLLPRRRRPTPLLLGLLALLLWGQCKFSLTDHEPLPSELLLEVKSTDRLVAASPGQPATLYLTLDLYNNTPQLAVLRSANGQLVYRGQQWPWAYAPASAADCPAVLPQGHQPLPITITIAPSDSVAALRASLHTASYLPMLTIEAAYSRRNTAAAPQRHVHTTSYLQLLPSP